MKNSELVSQLGLEPRTTKSIRDILMCKQNYRHHRHCEEGTEKQVGQEVAGGLVTPYISCAQQCVPVCLPSVPKGPVL